MNTRRYPEYCLTHLTHSGRLYRVRSIVMGEKFDFIEGEEVKLPFEKKYDQVFGAVSLVSTNIGGFYNENKIVTEVTVNHNSKVVVQTANNELKLIIGSHQAMDSSRLSQLCDNSVSKLSAEPFSFHNTERAASCTMGQVKSCSRKLLQHKQDVNLNPLSAHNNHTKAPVRDVKSVNEEENEDDDDIILLYYNNFKSYITESLCKSSKNLERKRGRPSSTITREYEEKRGKGPTTPILVPDVCLDTTAHRDMQGTIM
ncbi:hypothetical protein EXN66_Car005688 [Channa argus]|uniref:Uncharacterized protein n=1 Tax=Channa argus TaxID=215402 RepID=A0A6G1PJ33_CHAAH|nr:hypothetical protein EXN66_Car005688 [Channa argus]